MLPRFGALLSEWHPLQDAERGLQEFATWRPLLESDAQRDAIFQVMPVDFTLHMPSDNGSCRCAHVIRAL